MNALNQAKKAIAAKAHELGAEFSKVRTKTVSFGGFGYGDGKFIGLKGLTWTNGNKWSELKAYASEQGFILTDTL